MLLRPPRRDRCVGSRSAMGGIEPFAWASPADRLGEGFRSFPDTAGDGMLPSDFFRRNVVLSFQDDAIGISPTPTLTLPRLRGRVRVGASTT
jgi:hypothetical protein